MTTFTSCYLKKNQMNKKDAEQLTKEIILYNLISRKIVQALRTKRPKEEESIHCEYKRVYEATDYFITAAERKARGIREAAKAALKLDIETKTHRILQMESKAEALEHQLKNLDIMKQSLVERSKARAKKQPIPMFRTYPGIGIRTQDMSDGTTVFTVGCSQNRSKSKKREPQIFENDYLFELQYLDPMIRKKRARLHNIQSRIHNTKGHLEILKQRLKEERFVICFGGKKFSSAQYTTYAGKHQDWKSAYQKRRTWEMMLAGRCDATQGNFMVQYDTNTHQLTFRGHNGTTPIILDHVDFPYGQELVNIAVNTSQQHKNRKKLSEQEQRMLWEKLPIAWSIKDCGNAFQVKCTFQVPDNPNMNICYDNGCVGFDMNYDHLAVSETDFAGRLLRHYVVPFSPENKTSNQINNMLSEALEQVFHHAESVKKPVVMENIEKLKKEDTVYGNAIRNRKISTFAYDKIKTLAEHKSQKYGIGLKQVNPAYTSQIGKIKYMSRYGISIHEAASLVIARRGMGLKEKVPKTLHALLPKTKQTAHHWSQWAYITSQLKTVPTHQFYQKTKYDVQTFSQLKKKLIA